MGVKTFLICLFLLVYHHFGYPLALAIITKKRKLIKAGKKLPLNKFVFIIPMYNESKYIAKKIANLAQISYPEDHYEVWLLDDGSADKTIRYAQKAQKEYPGLHIKFFSSSINQGKVAWLNQLVPEIPKDYIVFFSDVSAILPSDVLHKANAYFNNPQVGVYCTRYQLGPKEVLGEKYYWHYQNDIKAKESMLGTPIGYHGTGYAIRRSLWQEIPSNTINEDFVIPLQIIARKFWGVYDPSCVSIENEISTKKVVFRRRIRLAAGNVQQVFILFKLLSPGQGWVAWMFFSCKVLRILMPGVLILLLISNAVLASKGSSIFTTLLIGQVLFYFTCALNFIYPSKITELTSHFIMGHLASFLGWFYFLKLKKEGRWQRSNKAVKHYYIHPIVFIGKWFMDKSFALIGLIILIAITPVVAITIKFFSSGPIFYKQLRVGISNENETRLFYIYKYRTMDIDSRYRYSRWTTKNDPRVFRFGYFMRKTHLDELPQIINILKGEMSLIGPRPERPSLFSYISKNIPYYQERLFMVRPGLTGLAQVTCPYDRTIEDVRRKVALDHAYATYLTKPWIWFKADINILSKTIRLIFRGKSL